MIYFSGHIHSGNVGIIKERAYLLDMEAMCLGAPSSLRPFLLKLRRIHSPTDVDIYSFGHLLFELTSGHKLTEPICDSLPDSIHTDIRKYLPNTY